MNSYRLNKNITRVVCKSHGEIEKPSYVIENGQGILPDYVFDNPGCEYGFYLGEKILFTQSGWQLIPKEIFRYAIDGEKAKIITKQTVDGERSFVENAATALVGSAYEGILKLKIEDGECIYGLGQHENGVFNYRSTKEYLYQNNMKIPLPVLISSKNYAIVFDSNCCMVYEENDNTITLSFDAVNQLDYYIITGRNFDDLVFGIRKLTGTAVLLPKWAFGYIQSKERYKTQEELLETIEKFEERDIPVSCIVQDWQTWESGKWGNKILDKTRFPNLKACIDKLHKKNVAFMVSIWPNVNKGCEDNLELLEAGKLLSNLSTYDAFDETAREIYWKQCERELFLAGTDAWWCDSTEPFTPDWNGAVKRSEGERYEISKETLTKYSDARNANTYALFHAKGIFENQIKTCKTKRVANLTRSGSLSIQKYGVILWSGDIKATWEVYKQQIAEGLSISACGIPYWTLDIGAFFVGSDSAWKKWSKATEGSAPWFWQGDFEGGADDFGYRELYTRWLQFGTFLPVMRSHGTDTAREPWNFGEPGTKYYDTIKKYINLRYRLEPYIYSLAAMVSREHYTIMRSLMFDFQEDVNAQKICDEYMFGTAFLVCPVTEPMEFAPNSTPLFAKLERKIYLPEGSGWFDFETGVCYNGGITMDYPAPIEKMPLFVRFGAIVPCYDKDEEIPYTVEVFEGGDGEFSLYFDNGTDYSYQDGNYSLIKISWNDSSRKLTFSALCGSYSYPQKYRIIIHKTDGTKEFLQLDYSGKETVVGL